MNRMSLRKPRHHFDIAAHPSHVTFDDGKELRRNLAWMNYTEARWEYAEPDTIKVEIGDWLVVITGYNLAPLFVVLEEQTLLRLRAQPQLKLDREREGDTFATAIRFLKAPAGNRLPQVGCLPRFGLS
jgi:hypothetical protein